jgi:hypothetical protein
MLRSLIASCAAAALLSFAGAAQATLIVYNLSLSGAAEGNASPGIGTATIAFDTVAHTMAVNTSFSGLTSPSNIAHIHCCTAVPGFGTAGVATQLPSFVGFPVGVTSGTYSNTFDLTLASSWNPAFVTANGGTTAGAETALLNGSAAGRSYLNIHTTAFPAGEIRGFLAPAPEPATWAMMILGFGLAGATLRRRRMAFA